MRLRRSGRFDGLGIFAVDEGEGRDEGRKTLERARGNKRRHGTREPWAAGGHSVGSWQGTQGSAEGQRKLGPVDGAGGGWRPQVPRLVSDAALRNAA